MLHKAMRLLLPNIGYTRTLSSICRAAGGGGVSVLVGFIQVVLCLHRLLQKSLRSNCNIHNLNTRETIQ